MRVAHLTSVHTRHDVRIFLKQCRSLAAAGHEVHLVVADDAPDEVRDGVRIHGVGRSRGRLRRFVGATARVLRRALSLRADVHHLHDPELLPVAATLKLTGAKIIFDAHEDLPRQILGKHYIHPRLRRPIASGARLLEDVVGARLDAIVTATPAIRDTLRAVNPRTIDINNYPLTAELAQDEAVGWEHKRAEVCFIGGMTTIRGLRPLVTAMSLVQGPARLVLGGFFQEAGLEATLRTTAGWERVDPLGFLQRPQVREVLGRAMAGVVTFLPVPNHIEAQPNKMFEYMSAGVPVIGSHFPLWREIIEGNDCGLCVDPEDPAAIAAAIDHLVAHPEEARRLGDNGRRAIVERYNWEAEQTRLCGLYEELTR